MLAVEHPHKELDLLFNTHCSQLFVNSSIQCAAMLNQPISHFPTLSRDDQKSLPQMTSYFSKGCFYNTLLEKPYG